MPDQNQKSIFRETSVANSELTEGSIETDSGYCYFSVYSTVMVFRPDFSFESAQECNGKGITSNSWLDSDTDTSPLRKYPLTRIEEIPLSPKSLGLSQADQEKVCAERRAREDSRIRRQKLNRKPYASGGEQQPIDASKRLERGCNMLDQKTVENSMLPVSSEAKAVCPSQTEMRGPTLLNSKAPQNTPSNIPSTTQKPTRAAAPHDGSQIRTFRPKLQLRTTPGEPAAASRRPTSGIGNRNINKEVRTSPPLTGSSRSSLESTSSRHSETGSRRFGSKLPLHSLLLSPLGIRRKSHNIPNTIAAPRKAPNSNNSSRVQSTVPSVPQTPLDETINEEDLAELSDMVTTDYFAAKEPSGSSRPPSRFRRFSLAYLSGSEHEYDGGSEQSSRSPLRSWRSWSNRSSVVSFSSANNKQGRSRCSAASISTSQGSTSSRLDHHPTRPESVYSDDRHRPSLSCSSVAELPWKQVQPQTYAHLMSSRRNSVVTTTTTTAQWQYSQTLTTFISSHKLPSPNLSAVASQSDTSSVHSLVERVYTTQTPASEKEDPFTAFYMATKPRMPSQLSQPVSQTDESIKSNERQKKEAAFAQQIENGGFYDSSDDEDDGLDDTEDDILGHSDSHDWWMSGIEDAKDDDWDIRRVPSLEFDPPHRESSVSTNTTLMTDELCPSTPTPSEIADYRRITEMAMAGIPSERRRSRRRTASSECLILDGVQGLRTMYLDETPDECAVEDEDTTYFTERSSQKTNTISSKSPSEAGTITYQRAQPLAMPPAAHRAVR